MATFASEICLKLVIFLLRLALFPEPANCHRDTPGRPSRPSHYSRNVTASRAVPVMVTVYGRAIQTIPP